MTEKWNFKFYLLLIYLYLHLSSHMLLGDAFQIAQFSIYEQFLYMVTFMPWLAADNAQGTSASRGISSNQSPRLIDMAHSED